MNTSLLVVPMVNFYKFTLTYKVYITLNTYIQYLVLLYFTVLVLIIGGFSLTYSNNPLIINNVIINNYVGL